MGDLKKIGNRAILRALADLLQVEGVSQRAPTDLDTSRLIPIIGLDAGWAGYEMWSAITALPESLALISQFTWPIVGNESGSVIMTNYRQTQNGAHEYVILGYKIQIAYTAAGGVTDDGDVLQIDFIRQREPNQPVIFESQVEIGTIENTGTVEAYGHAHPVNLMSPYMTAPATPRPAGVAQAPIWVPAGSVYSAIVGKKDGSVFAAGTTASVWSFGIRVPKGIKPPMV